VSAEVQEPALEATTAAGRRGPPALAQAQAPARGQVLRLSVLVVLVILASGRSSAVPATVKDYILPAPDQVIQRAVERLGSVPAQRHARDARGDVRRLP